MSRSCCWVVATGLLFLSFSLAAQEGPGGGRVSGVVLGPDGEPLAGAEVTLRPATEEDGGPAVEGAAAPPVVTGEDGGWAWVRLPAGVWEIQVEARGHLPAEGRVVVPAAGTGEAVRIELRSLDEVPPASVESDPAGTVRRWLRRGDAFLDQGRSAEARAEYERVLRTPGVLSGAERAEVLETVARTHFLEGDREGAERALLAALLVASPSSGDRSEAARLRELYTVLLQGAGRGDEARELLARLDREPEVVRREHAQELGDLVEPEEPASAPPDAAEPASGRADRPVLPPEPHRRGRYRTAFPAEIRSPLSDPKVVLGRYGGEPEGLRAVDPSLGRYELAEETFELYVPEGYRPAAEGEPGWGLLVWVSPTASGGIYGVGGVGERGDPERQAVLDRERLLWVGANDAGNARFTWNRVGLALDAAHAMAALYDLDPARVYAAGYSGGGRIASALALLFPETFRGALSLFGASIFRSVPVPDRPGSHWSPAFPAPPERSLRELRQESRLVLLTGERDFNRAQTRAVARALEEDGFRRVTYLEIPGASHYDLPDAAWLRRALEALDGPGGPSTR